MFTRFKTFVPVIVTLTLLSACGSNKNALPSAGYRTARAQSNLELPPDLVNSSTATLQQTANSRENPALATIEGVKLRSKGENRWLEVTAGADDTWTRLIDYFNKSGLPILVENKRDGILETDWIGDPESDSYGSAMVRAKVGDLFGRAPVNDKFTIWMESIDAENTSIHVAHNQLKQFVIEPQGQRAYQIDTGWTETPGDGFKTMKMLRDMAAFFGGADIETINTDRVLLVQTVPPHIILDETENKAWDLVERAIITSATYALLEMDREESLFKIEEMAEPGFWNKMKLTSKYGVFIGPFGDSGKTRISITNKKGDEAMDRNDALPVLWSLAGELRRMESTE